MSVEIESGELMKAGPCPFGKDPVMCSALRQVSSPGFWLSDRYKITQTFHSSIPKGKHEGL